jgi:hypothetical protein
MAARRSAFARRAAATAMLLVGACVVGAAALTTARQPSRLTEVASAEPAPMERLEQETTPRAVSSRRDVTKPTASKGVASTVPGKTPAQDKPAAKMPAEAPKLPTVSNVQALAPVTITGCLEMARGSFRLKDTSGADAPRSRSWKSGFLKKRSSQIELVDDANTLRLPTYVGQRVVATGTLADGEMRARSLKRVAASCD